MPDTHSKLEMDSSRVCSFQWESYGQRKVEKEPEYLRWKNFSSYLWISGQGVKGDTRQPSDMNKNKRQIHTKNSQKKKLSDLLKCQNWVAGQDPHRNKILGRRWPIVTSVCACRELGELWMSQDVHHHDSQPPHTSRHLLLLSLGTEPHVPPINCSPLIKHFHMRQAFFSRAQLQGYVRFYCIPGPGTETSCLHRALPS